MSERVSYFPKTKYSLNSTVVDFSLMQFNFSGYTNGRVAMEMVMVNGQEVNDSSTMVTTTIDDEYTPSVFRTLEYYFNPSGSRPRAYLQWKPISYQSHNRKSTKSQEANVVFPKGNAVSILNGEVPASLASALFNSSSVVLNGTAMYIVIGTSGDDNYVNSEHMTW